MSTRLRRSLRGGPPPALTEEDKFEKIISYVKEGNYSENLRQFNIPSHILLDFQANNSPTQKTELETLPTDVLLEIMNALKGTDQIIASLVCKTFAAVIETSSVRKIANITIYMTKSQDPAYRLTQKDPKEIWHQCGLEYVPSPLTYTYDYWPDYSPVRRAEHKQVEDMKVAVGKWLGSKYRFCGECHKFRLVDPKVWKRFAEYENPGITKQSALPKQKKKGKKGAKEAKENDAAGKVDKLIDDWVKGIHSLYFPTACPAHGLLKENGDGKRAIKRFEYGT